MKYFSLPSGVQDLLPEERYHLNLLRDKLEKKFSSFGCVPVSSAAIEYYSTFSSISNSIPEERLFKMTDKDGKLLVLRPDMTLSAARIVATKLSGNEKLSYVSDVWNYSSSEGVSQREFLQAGVECFGVSSPLADATTIAFAIECLKEIGLKDFIVDLGHVGFFKGLLSSAALKEEDAEEIRLAVNAKDSLSVSMALTRAKADEELVNAILALPTLFGGEEVFARAEKLTKNQIALSALNHLKKVYDLLKSFSLEKYVSIDLGTVKSLAYYSGIVFTGYVKGFGTDVLSGGRYDALAEEFGRDIPAVGFAMGLKRCLMALERQSSLTSIPPLDVFLVSEEGAESVAYEAYLKLSAEGKRVNFFAGSKEEGLKMFPNANCREGILATKEGLIKL